MKIYKYPLSFLGNRISLPKNAQPLCVKLQRDIPCLWAMVDPNEPVHPVKVECVPTGCTVPDNVDKYLGTVLTDNGTYVFHFFTLKD